MIDRARLKSALDILSTPGEMDFSSISMSNHIAQETVDIKAVYVVGFGLVTFPINQDDLVGLGKMVNASQEQKMYCKIDASELTLIPKARATPQKKQLQQVTSDILQRMLNVNFEFLSCGVEATLDKLIICSDGELVTVPYNLLIESGKFGMLMLQIPLEVDKPPGRAVVYGGAVETAVLGFASSNSFSAVAVVGRRSVEKNVKIGVQSHPEGTTAVLMFNLIWNDYVTFGQSNVIPPRCFPQFLVLANEIKNTVANAETDSASQEAREMLEFIVETTRESSPDNFKKLFHVSLVALAIILRGEDETDRQQCLYRMRNLNLSDEEIYQQPLDLLASHMRHLEPPRLIELMAHLQKLAREHASTSCKPFMQELSKMVIKMSFSGFTPNEFFRMADIYSSANDDEAVSSSWKMLCSRCIQISRSDEKKPCLFCHILREDKPPQVRQQMVTDLVQNKEFKDAVKCSLKKVADQLEHFNVTSCVEYIDCILLLEQAAELTRAEIVVEFSTLFLRLNPDIQYLLASALLESSFDKISQKPSTMRRIFESLLKCIGANDYSTLSSEMRSILTSFAWFGNVELVNLIICKLNTAIANGETTSSMKLSLLTSILKEKRDRFGPPVSSLHFNRDVFNYLLFQCISSIDRNTSRISRYVTCFKLLATAERSFIDSTPRFVTDQWKRVTESLTVSEAAAIVRIIFQWEMQTEKAGLKKFPACWDRFKELCSGILSKWTPTENMSSNDVKVLLHSFFWIGEEKGIADCCRFLNEIQRSSNQLSNIHSVVIRGKRTVELAASSVHAALAFNDLIDTRIRVLIAQSASKTVALKEIGELQALKKEVFSKAFVSKQSSKS